MAGRDFASSERSRKSSYGPYDGYYARSDGELKDMRFKKTGGSTPALPPVGE
jgi:hypothetical protein